MSEVEVVGVGGEHQCNGKRRETNIYSVVKAFIGNCPGTGVCLALRKHFLATHNRDWCI